MGKPPGLRTGLTVGMAVFFLLGSAVSLAVLTLAGQGPGETSLPYARILIALAAVLCLALPVAAHLFRKHVIAPLEEISETAETVADGELDRRARPGGGAELRAVARGVNRMADRLIRERRLLAENVQSLEETNQRLVEARDELVRAEKLASVGRLASGLAHEIGNPLNAIMSYADVGRRQGCEGEWLDGLEHEANRIDRIVTGLLSYARPGDDENGPLDVNETVRSSIELLEAQGRFRGIEVRTRLEDRLPEALGKPDQLQHVMINLLLNACDAVQEVEDTAEAVRYVEVRTSVREFSGQPSRKPKPRRTDDPEEVDYSHIRRVDRSPGGEMEHRLEPGQTVICIEVLDSGPGLEADDPGTTVFDPFYTTKEPGRGTGLGLTISARFVSSMGGLIEASDSEDADGAEFRILLPVSDPAAGGDAEAGSRLRSAGTGGGA